jgi:hypothetical protein
MKRRGIILLAVIVAVVGAYFLFFHKSEEKQEEKQKALTVTKNSEGFNASFTQVLAAYDSLHNAFVNWDTVTATEKAGRLQVLLSNFPMNEVKGDSSLIITAKTFTDAASGEAQAIASANTIEEKRRSFYTLSENLYNLAMTVRYDQQVLYHVNCPMAFNDEEEAFWLSRNNEVVNPYLGTKHPKYKNGMLNCGEVKDSIDFRVK